MDITTKVATGHEGSDERRRSRTHNQALGAYGEELAARHLVELGMVLLDRNWRGEGGEIDLVLRDGPDLVICEVKTRSSDVCGSPHEAIGEAKARRLRRLAWQWLREHQARPREVRVDLVAVLRPRRGPSQLEHVRGIA